MGTTKMHLRVDAIDAIKKIKLELKPCHFLNAIPRDPENCVVALAGKEQIKNLERIRVYRRIIYVKIKNEKELRFRADPGARAALIALDTGIACVPKEGITVNLLAPSGRDTLTYQRRPDVLKQQRITRAKRRKAIAKGSPIRHAPDPLTVLGVRLGGGFHLSK